MDKPFKLIVESPNYELKYLVEEKNRNDPANMYIKGPFLMADLANRNNRIYPLEEMRREVTRYTSDMINQGRSMGELNHSSVAEVNLEKVCHLVTELRENGNIFEGKSKILNTPLGMLTKTLIKDGVKLGVSSRALGQINEKNGKSVVSDFRLVSIDVVADPSVPTAFVNGILESKQWVLNESGNFESLYEDFETKIKTLPRKAQRDFLKEQVISFINALKTL